MEAAQENAYFKKLVNASNKLNDFSLTNKLKIETGSSTIGRIS